MAKESNGNMTTVKICKGCYLWENRLEANCNYDPIHETTGEIICPCIECLVKCVCGQDINCDKFIETFITGSGDN
jgi:hypothetical protein